ncbi:xyloglucan endotransglucosylase/hydrolase protein 2-like [Malania oleifera]|uniref:xyloglucan endotransglucosylase/hydrolase protein 2-like n=1 Tax=Malania oleifera TaxID=397392 RepID=UPI0025AE0980|nr:xyloglucan endotransglucosylase/hydrolase protein 2-like [Malania oleifera]
MVTMNPLHLTNLCAWLLLAAGGMVLSRGNGGPSFDENYYITWGNDHVQSLDQGRELQLSMDRSSGSGFGSKLSYGSGLFHLRLKLPDKDSAGVVIAFYLTSHNNKHDELDFEFLGNKEGKPYTLQTNVFANGYGNREQRMLLWFDPTTNFHSYKILWNEHQIIFYVDDIPIRVFKNNTNTGVSYPSQPMQVEASLWNGDNWATDGGKTKTNWSHAPFVAHFQGFNLSDACPFKPSNGTNRCYSSNYWWNSEKHWKLDPLQEEKYKDVRKKYMTYDYCTDRPRYPTPFPECIH